MSIFVYTRLYPVVYSELVYCTPRKRMETEAKAKVVASVWGDNIYSISCRSSYFASVDLKEKDEFNFSSKSTEAK